MQFGVFPRQFSNWIGEFAAFFFIQGFDALIQLAHDVQIGQRFAVGICARVVPLQPARRVHNRAFFFGKAWRRQPENFGADFAGVGGVRFAMVFPERCGFGFQRIHHHHKFELGERFGYTMRIGERALRVEALHQQAFHPALIHVFGNLQDVVHFFVFRQPVIRPVVFGSGIVAIHPFEEAHEKGGRVFPIVQLVRLQGFGRVGVEIIL